MGKTGGKSWLNVVKKAFRSPTKDTKKSSKRREEHEQEDDEKKRGKRRWIFSKPCIYQTTIQHNEAKNVPATANTSLSNPSSGTNNLKSEKEVVALQMSVTVINLHWRKLKPCSKREKALSYAFSRQMWRSSKDRSLGNEEKARWSDGDTMKQWKKTGRNSFDHRERIQTVEIDNVQSYSSYSAPNSHRSLNHYYNFQQQKPNSDFISSPIWRANKNLSVPSYITPYPSKTKPLQVHSASPRCLKGERNLIMARTPNLGSSYYGMGGHENAGAASMPNYMATTASTKARIRSQSAPRQRAKMGSAKKRLFFPIPDEPDTGVVMSDVEVEHNLRSSSCKPVNEGHLSNTFCCCEDSRGEESISPPSTSHIRMVFR